MTMPFSELVLRHMISGLSYLQTVHANVIMDPIPMLTAQQLAAIEAILTSLEKHADKIAVDDWREVMSKYAPLSSVWIELSAGELRVGAVITPRDILIHTHLTRQSIDISKAAKCSLDSAVKKAVDILLEGLGLR